MRSSLAVMLGTNTPSVAAGRSTVNADVTAKPLRIETLS